MGWSEWYSSSGEFLDATFPHAPWLIEGLVAGAGQTFLYATAGTGKSILAWQILESIASGEPLLDLGRPNVAPGIPCAYVQVDEPLAEWQAQMKMMNARRLPNVYMPREPVDPFPLAREQTRQLIRKQFAQANVQFSVWDSAYKLADDLDLNEDSGVIRLHMRLLTVTLGRPYLLLGHTRKSKPGQETPDDLRDMARSSALLVANASIAVCMPDTNTLVVTKARLCRTGKRREYARDDTTARWVLKPPRAPRSAPGAVPWLGVAPNRPVPGSAQFPTLAPRRDLRGLPRAVLAFPASAPEIPPADSQVAPREPPPAS